MPGILYVSHVSALGGAERSLLQLITALPSKWQAAVALPGDGPLASELKAMGVPVDYAPMRRLYRTLNPLRLIGCAGRYCRVACAIRRIINRRRPDIVHSNNTTAHLFASGPARGCGLPAVWHNRDMRGTPAIEHFLSRRTDALVAVSRAVMDSHKGVRLPGIIRKVIHNSLDADRFAASARPGVFRSELGLAASVPLVTAVCQIVPWKRLDVLIDAVSLCRKRGISAYLAIVGEDMFGVHAGYLDGLKRLAADLGLGDCVAFTGYRADVTSAIADSDVVAVPSDAEPFGRVALEAMALGKPVVGTSAGGLPEVVEDGRTGLLVPAGDAYLLSKAIQRLVDDPPLAATLGSAGYDRVRQCFSPVDHARAMEDLYLELLNRKATQRIA